VLMPQTILDPSLAP